MSKQIKDCKNCEQPFDEAYEYCPYCGQKDKDELTIGVLFYNTISNYFSFDARFFKSFLPLLFRPGYLAKKFISGKRLLYLHPAQLYLFVSVVFFFLFSFSTRKQVSDIDNNIADAFSNRTSVKKDSLDAEALKAIKVKDSIKREEVREALKKNAFLTGMTEKQIDSLVETDNFKKNGAMSFDFNEFKVDSLIAAKATDAEIYKEMGLKEDDGAFKRRLYAQVLKFYKSKKGGSILEAFYDTIPIAMFFLLPIFALILKLLYFKKGRYAHHLVFSFYYFAFLFTVFSIILGVNFIVDIPNWVDFLIMLSTFIYLLIALKQFYQQGWFMSFLKSGITTFLFLVVVTPLAAVIIGLFAFMFY
ncbi:DUF3667 domain-containing protein [uncultured Lacinutrix sp.]|uniref:DUF3667 domain-containing protein n=1 Tax=uncultured Lacinutrix sp. TaxID=574032 RepID=UPI0026295141|nr:DUF3667 domain-containing protein [uncultured Lacinutrix sp.]